jgi:hypothetical protein
MGILETGMITEQSYIGTVEENNIVEWEGISYVCKTENSKPGTQIFTTDPSDKLAKMCIVVESNKDFLLATPIGKTNKIKKYHGLNSYHATRPLMLVVERETIADSISEAAKKISGVIKSNPALQNREKLQNQPFELKRDFGFASINMLIHKNIIICKVTYKDEDFGQCKFNSDIKHDLLDTKMKNNIIFQLFGEELVYVRNLMESSIK